MKRAFKRQVGNETVVVVLDTKDLEADDDLHKEASRVASQMGLVAGLLAEATVALTLAEVAQRSRRAQLSEQVLAETPDIAQWRVDRRVEAMPEYLTNATFVAKAEGDVVFLKTYHDALRLQSSMVRARVDLQRQEYDVTRRFSGGDADEADEPKPEPRAKPTKIAKAPKADTKTAWHQAMKKPKEQR